MKEIIPAIIPEDFYDLQGKMSLVVGLSRLVQIDVLDGKLTPEPSWPYNVKEDAHFLEIVRGEKGFPYWEKLDFEVDLMVEDPFLFWENWFNAGAKRIIFHIESKTNWETLISEFKKYSVEKDLPFYTELGFAINIDTPLEKLLPVISHADFIQCMGIARIGFQGEPFDVRVIDKIKEIKKQYPEMTISVDGGVSLDNAQALLEAGATRLVSGSAIFEDDDIPSAIGEFRNLLQ